MSVQLADREIDDLTELAPSPNVMVAVPEAAPSHVADFVKHFHDAKCASYKLALNFQAAQQHFDGCAALKASHTIRLGIALSGLVIDDRENEPSKKWRCATLAFRSLDLFPQK